MHVLATIPLAMQLVIPVADRPPTLNIETSCRAVATRSTLGTSQEGCMRSERQANDRLGEEWTKFTVSDRSYCVGLSTLGGLPSYVELLTCLEMARDARALPDNSLADTPSPSKPAPSTTGQATPDIPR